MALPSAGPGRLREVGVLQLGGTGGAPSKAPLGDTRRSAARASHGPGRPLAPTRGEGKAAHQHHLLTRDFSQRSNATARIRMMPMTMLCV